MKTRNQTNTLRRNACRGRLAARARMPLHVQAMTGAASFALGMLLAAQAVYLSAWPASIAEALAFGFMTLEREDETASGQSGR